MIYGADATGGVVNFITRDSFVGLEMSAQYKYIDGSDGDYGFGNGPGQTTKGFDLQTRYTMPIWRGTFTAGLTATKITELKTGPTQMDGVTVSTGDDRLGFLNFASEMNEGLAFTATVANIFDRDPPKAQEEFGYDPWTANPLGRTFEIGVKKAF